MDGVRGRVRELIQRSGWPQREFGAAIGLEATKLSKSLTGTRRFTAEELVKIADATGVTVNWLLHGRDDAATVSAAPRASSVLEPLESGAGPEPQDTAEQARRWQILQAAWELIADRGYHSVRVADIAAACGTSTATVHYYFPALRGLLIEALRYSVKQAFDRQVAGLHESDDARERLLSLVEMQLPHPGRLRKEWSIWLQVWTAAALDPRMRELHSDSYRRWHETIAAALRYGQSTGDFQVFDTDEMTTRLTALIDGLGVQVLAGRSGRTVADMRRILHDEIHREVFN